MSVYPDLWKTPMRREKIDHRQARTELIAAITARTPSNTDPLRFLGNPTEALNFIQHP